MMDNMTQVCFPLSDTELGALEQLAGNEGVSVQEAARRIVLESVEKVTAKKSASNGSDRRKFYRKDSSIPVVIQIHYNNEEHRIISGTITDISAGGVKITIPKNKRLSIELVEDSSHLEILFRFPEESDPAIFKCLPKRISLAEEDLQIGAMFVDGKFESHQSLYKYVM